MVDAVLSPVVDNLKRYIVDEASLYIQAEDDVKWLQSELEKLLTFLHDAETQQKRGNEEVNRWLRNIRDVAYDAEDVIETFMLKADDFPSLDTFMLIIRSCSTTPIESFREIIGRCIPIFTSTRSRYVVGREIRKLKARINDISTQRSQLGIVTTQDQSSTFRMQQHDMLTFRRYDATGIVGLERDKEIILEKLQSAERRRCVISICGMGGLGKTTLARKVYHSKEAEDFVVRAWVDVSQNYKIPKLLKDLIEVIIGIKYADVLTEKELQDRLNQILRSKGRYLIVLDDVWDYRLWDEIKTAFPDERNGSRLIFTTRSGDVARHVDPDTDPYFMPFLNEEESRGLFLKKINPNSNIKTFPTYLRDVGERLVRKCQGLALALVVLGGLVSRKERNYYQWSIVLKNLNWHATDEESICLDILGLSYNSLPHYLKPCFLYIGSFPEDSHINASQLMRLWFAEGFIQGREENAEAILEELVQRSLVQVAERRWDGSIKKVRIHDLLREFCIKEAKEHGFLHSGSSHQPISSDITATRRLVVNGSNSTDNYFNSSDRKWRTPKLRALLGFSLSGVGYSYNGLTLLRVLDMTLQDTSAKLSEGIACLIHLRYLRWWGHSEVDYGLIENLHNLQTVDVRPSIVNADASIGKLSRIQFLRKVDAGIWIEGGLAMLNNLERLVIKELDKTHWDKFVESFGHLHKLFSLSLITNKTYRIPARVLASISRQQSLCVLKLDGIVDQRINSSAFSDKLTKLTLRSSQLRQDPMSLLKALPNLIYLKLKSAYKGRIMSCVAGGFPRLQHLTLDFLPCLADWNVSVGSLPSLTFLTIRLCQNLKMLPSGLKSLTTLQELKLLRMPPHFIRRIHEHRGPDYHKVQHIPSIIINY